MNRLFGQVSTHVRTYIHEHNYDVHQNKKQNTLFNQLSDNFKMHFMAVSLHSCIYDNSPPQVVFLTMEFLIKSLSQCMWQSLQSTLF